MLLKVFWEDSSVKVVRDKYRLAVMFVSKILNCEMGGRMLKLRCLRDSDITQAYIDTLNNESKYLETKKSFVTTESQRLYVEGIEKSPDRLIFGFFLDGQLIGTSGAQSISVDGFTIGILIFDQWRGRGLGKVLVWIVCRFIGDILGGEVIRAGIKPDNAASLSSFIKCGFSIKDTDPNHHKLELIILSMNNPFSLSVAYCG